jgi:hypothetical protein
MAQEFSKINNPTPPNADTPLPERKPFNLGKALVSVGIYLVELILPVALAAVMLYYVVGYVSLWSLYRTVSLVIFGIVLVALTAGITILYDTLVTFVRRGKTISRKKMLMDFRLRMVRLVVAGLVLPAGVMVAANLVNLPGGGTLMTYYIQSTLVMPKSTPAVMMGDAVIRTTSPAAKEQGIKTLQTIHSTEALDQLIRILKEGSALQDAGEYEALSQAIASYGVQAKPQLLDVFQKAPPEKQAVSFSDDLYGRYLSDSINALRQEITNQTADPRTRQATLDQLDTAVSGLQRTLTDIQSNQLSLDYAASQQDFVMHTCLAMNLNQDADLVNFAKVVAANTTYSDGLRGNALLLIAKVGGKGEFDVLYQYLASDRDALKLKAMEAIAALQTKVSGGK